ncbi:MAG: hypothetical protein KAU14_09235, partial [Thermoplasmata archaeon]|nr:hypothetical protein [Thermoplasmata archaeon]
DNITEYAWDLDGNSEFGEVTREKKMNTTVYLGKGHHTLGLMVADGIKHSKIVDIKFFIRIPISYPDLIVDDIGIDNLNGLDVFEKGDRANIVAYVKNLGDNESSGSFEVYFEYRFVDTNDDYEYLGTARAEETIYVSGILPIQCEWNTESEEFIPGNYTFRATADYSEEVYEQDEHNNYFESYKITLEPEGGDTGTPILSIQEVALSADKAQVNDVVYINVTIRNDGDGKAKYVDIYFYIDGVLTTEPGIPAGYIDDLGAGSEKTQLFVFSGDSEGLHRLKFEIWYRSQVVDTSDTYTVDVWAIEPPNGNNQPPENNESNEEGISEMLPIIIAVVVIGGGLGGAGFFFMRKREEDVW